MSAVKYEEVLYQNLKNLSMKVICLRSGTTEAGAVAALPPATRHHIATHPDQPVTGAAGRLARPTICRQFFFFNFAWLFIILYFSFCYFCLLFYLFS